jgi:hypothetical protein
MFDRDDDYYDPNEYVHIPPPDIQITAHLHGGPYDGETMGLPWPRLKLPLMTWDGDDQVESVYEMQGRWVGHQRDVHYRFVEPAVAAPVPIGRPRARRAQLALRAARDAWRRAA